DTTWGTGGQTPLAFAGEGLLVNPDGSVLAAGTDGSDYKIARFQGGQTTHTSQLDVTLNRKGTLLLSTPGGDEDDIRVYPPKRDGRLVVLDRTLARSFSASKVKKIAIFPGSGSDRVVIDPVVAVNAYV